MNSAVMKCSGTIHIFQDGNMRCQCGNQDRTIVSSASAMTADLSEASASVSAPITQHERYWLYRFLDAVEAIEEHAICRCDLDCLAPSEDEKLRRFLGILQDFALGYAEDRPTPRLSRALRSLIVAEDNAAFEATSGLSGGGPATPAPPDGHLIDMPGNTTRKADQ